MADLLGAAFVLLMVFLFFRSLVDRGESPPQTQRTVDARACDRASLNAILELGDEADRRNHGQGSRRNERTRLLLPSRRLVNAMNFDAQTCARWLEREGASAGITVEYENEKSHAKR